MSKKTPKPTPKPRRLSKKAIILITIPLLIFVILPLSIFAYIKLLDYQDAQKFQSLKADMLTLQTEFNKIMPGWEYEEGCREGGVPFGRGNMICTSRLKAPDVAIDYSDAYIAKVRDVMNVDGLEEYQKESRGESKHGVRFGVKPFNRDNGGCLIEFEELANSKTSVTLYCTYMARNAYFALKQ